MRSSFIRSFVGLTASTVVIGILAACTTTNNTGNRLVGSGNVKTETRNVSGFNAITITGSGTVSITVTRSESLTIDAEDNLLPVLTSDVSGNRLTLGVKDNTSIQPTKPIKYSITVKDLNDVQLTGSAGIVLTQLDTNSFTYGLSGSGSMLVRGKTNALTINITGSGSFNGVDLDAKTATITNSGSGSIVVKVSDTLDANLSGSGSVQYIGNPTVTKKITGSGSVTQQ